MTFWGKTKLAASDVASFFKDWNTK